MEERQDLISRQAAIDDAHKQIWYRMNHQGMKDRIDEWLNSLPSAQPEIIHCRECEDGEIDDPDIPNQYYCKYSGCWNNRDHFCGYANRRENNGSE